MTRIVSVRLNEPIDISRKAAARGARMKAADYSKQQHSRGRSGGGKYVHQPSSSLREVQSVETRAAGGKAAAGGVRHSLAPKPMVNAKALHIAKPPPPRNKKAKQSK